MLNDIMYSIKRHLRDDGTVVVNEVLTFYDGIELDNRSKPIIVIESLFDDFEVLAAGRDDYAETYVLQIGIRAESESQLNTLKRTVTQSLRQPIELVLTASLPTVVSPGNIYVDVARVEAVRPDDLAQEAQYHRAYITAEISAQFDESTGGFTQ